MAPNYTLLHIGDSTTGYNNGAIIAGPNEKIGLNMNVDLNEEIPIYNLYIPPPKATLTDTLLGIQTDTQNGTLTDTHMDTTTQHETNKMVLLAAMVGISVVIDFNIGF